MARIALCMIVRDEEHWLPGCLDSVGGLVDEIVVVDTGSSDRTAQIAAEKGAVVVPFVWQSDFAAARNAALAATRCEWVLQLDADERLAPGGAAALRRACDEGGFDCGFVTLLNARSLDDTVDDVLHKPACRYDEPTALARVFRRDADLRWQGRVHENVAAWMSERRVRRLDAALVHYGYTPEVARARGKKERNLGLLERWCDEQPENPLPWTYLAWERQSAADPAVVQGAAHAAAQGWAVLLRKAATIPAGEHGARLPSPVALATVKAMHELGKDALDDADETLAQAARWTARHPNLDVLRAQLAERRAALATNDDARALALVAARQAYERCVAAAGQVFTDWTIDGATSWFAATGLGLCLVELGAPAAALEAFTLALNDRPAHVPAQLGRAEALIDLHRHQEAMAALLQLLDDAELRRHVDAWLLAARASHLLGHHDDAVLLTRTAEGALAAGGSVHPWRVRRLDALRAALLAPPDPASG